MLTTWAMAAASRLVDNKEEKGKGGKSYGDGNEGGGQQRGQGRQGHNNNINGSGGNSNSSGHRQELTKSGSR
jgi:hypothetical protein